MKPCNPSIDSPAMETTTAPPPTPRQMLTSLINSISSIPLSEPDGDGDGKPSSSPASPSSSPDANSNNNPKASQQRTQNHSAITKPPATGGGSGLLLHHRMASYRPLLTTLHALFPTLLLAALDLLDRGLVARLEMRNEHDEPNAVYHVRSAAAATTTAAAATYAVRLAAWSCSCAGFAFSAFSGSGIRDPRDLGAGDGGLDDGGRWEFGGLSTDGRRRQGGDGSGGDDAGLVEIRGAPCCKHLLACLLADRWPVARRCVVEKHVSREELAGVMAGI